MTTYRGTCPKCGTKLEARPKRGFPHAAFNAVMRQFDETMAAMNRLMDKIFTH